jgi:hypothetical protein
MWNYHPLVYKSEFHLKVPGNDEIGPARARPLPRSKPGFYQSRSEYVCRRKENPTGRCLCYRFWNSGEPRTKPVISPMLICFTGSSSFAPRICGSVISFSSVTRVDSEI